MSRAFPAQTLRRHNAAAKQAGRSCGAVENLSVRLPFITAICLSMMVDSLGEIWEVELEFSFGGWKSSVRLKELVDYAVSMAHFCYVPFADIKNPFPSLFLIDLENSC